MPWFSLHRDGVALLVLVLLFVMLWAGLAGGAEVFAYALTALIATLAAVGFVRRGRWRTWLPPLLVATALAVSFAGMFASEDVVVQAVRDTRLGFHPGTAYLVYGLWIPAFFTLGIGFALLFDEVTREAPDADPREDGR